MGFRVIPSGGRGAGVFIYNSHHQSPVGGCSCKAFIFLTLLTCQQMSEAESGGQNPRSKKCGCWHLAFRPLFTEVVKGRGEGQDPTASATDTSLRLGKRKSHNIHQDKG